MPISSQSPICAIIMKFCEMSLPGEPVFLTKNGRGRYAVVDIQVYEKSQAMVKLLTELARGVRSGQEEVGSHWTMWKRRCWGEVWQRYKSPVGTAGLAEYPPVIETELANPVAARRTVERVLKSIRQLEQFPYPGRPCSIMEQTQGIAM